MRAAALALLALILASCASAQGSAVSGFSLGAPAVSGGGSANVLAAFDCRSFGQTVSDGGTLNIKYATPITCWAYDSTVVGVNVNVTGFVPEVFFEWDWDDNSLGTVSRGGLTVDLGESVGPVAAHAFRPSTFAESCGGGTNSQHTVTLTVYSVVAGVRESDSATLTVCVEDPATTWPNPVAYCDDSDCSNDTFSNVVNPGTPTHGGNGTALNTILAQCATTSKRILVESGVTFTTGSQNTSVGANRCLLESYGAGQANLSFTGTGANYSILADNAACAGYVVQDVNFVGAGGNARVIGGSNAGCYALIDVDFSDTPGQEFASLTNSSGANYQSEGYYFKARFDRQVGGLPQSYIRGSYTVFVGGEMRGVSGEHNIRLPQWEYAVIDAMLLDDQTSGRSLVTLRHDCDPVGGICNAARPSVSKATLSRNEFRVSTGGTAPVQFMGSGSGTDEPTKFYDLDFVRNLCARDATFTNQPRSCYNRNSATAGGETARVRWVQNVTSLTSYDRGAPALEVEGGGTNTDWAFFGNTVWGGTNANTLSLANMTVTSFTVKNNLGAENGAGSINLFPGSTVSADNKSLSVNPFTGTPGLGDSFVITDAAISGGGAADDVGVVSAPPTDIAGNACDAPYDSGAYCTP